MIKSKFFFHIFFLGSLPLLIFKFQSNKDFKLGIDILKERKFSDLQNKNVGILTNGGALDSNGKPTLNIFFERQEFQLKSVFFPEHNEGTTITSNALSHSENFQLGSISSSEEREKIINRDQLEKKNIRVYCTHTPNRRSPEPEWLKGLDVVVIDLQDIGIRYYTYAASMLHTMIACFNANIEVIILDRPNPLGSYIGGPIMEKDNTSFLGMFEGEPLFHGMTIAEKANYIKNRGKDFELKCNCGSKTCAHGAFCSAANLKKGKLTVIKMREWKRTEILTKFGSYKNDSIIPLSPLIQNVASIFEYAMISLATMTNKESSIGFLWTLGLPQAPQRSFKNISSVVPINKVLDEIKTECPKALDGCTLIIKKSNNCDYLELSLDDISKTTPALLSFSLIAQAQKWIPECDWVEFEKKLKSSQDKTKQQTNTSHNIEKLTPIQQKDLRKAKWDRLTKLQKELFRKHLGDNEIIKKLFNGELIDINYFDNKWKRSAILFLNETKKYYLY